MSPITPAEILHDNSNLSFKAQPEVYDQIIEVINQQLRGIWTLDERLRGRKVSLRDIVQVKLSRVCDDDSDECERQVKSYLLAVLEDCRKIGWQISLPTEPYTYISKWTFHFPERTDILT